VGEARPAGFDEKVDVGIDASVLSICISDFEKLRRMRGSIDEVVAVGITRYEGDAVAGAQSFLAIIADQRQLAFEDPNEFVLVTMPVALTGPAAGWDHGQVHAESGDALGAGDRLTHTVDTGLVEGGRVARAAPRGHGIYENSFQAASAVLACSAIELSPLYFSPSR
jgi:hypothetical protein